MDPLVRYVAGAAYVPGEPGSPATVRSILAGVRTL